MKKMQRKYNYFESPQTKLQKKSKKQSLNIEQLAVKQDKKLKIQIVDDIKKCNILCRFDYSTPLSEVKQKIMQKIKQQRLNFQKIIGFQTSNSNYAFDYKFQCGIGVLQNHQKLSCFYFQESTGLEKYKICCCLSIGGFSKVFLVRSKMDSKFYAAKFIDKQKKELINQTLLQNQKQISLKLSSPFLVKTHQFIENNQFFVFIMDYCPGGQLFYLLKQIKCINQLEARVFFIQILLGIEVLHNNGYMYRDLKPQNILLDQLGFVKIADFGLAKLCSSKSYSFCGSVQYMAPQIIRGKGHSKYVDFYCLGALLFELLVGHPPFYDPRLALQQTKAKILLEDIKFPRIPCLSNQVKDFILKLTNKNERQRLGYFGGCKQIMAHPWIGKIDRTMYMQRRFHSPFQVNLDKLNFDPQQIGQSQRNFQQRIKNLITLNQNLIKRPNKQKTFLKMSKSLSHKTYSKSFNSPNKNKSVIFNSMQKQNINKKSPYQKILSCKSMKKIKTQKNEQISKFGPKKYIQSIRWTQSQGFGKQNNKMLSSVTKLRKKYRFVPFTSNHSNHILQKNKDQLIQKQ